jgi:hypothetical protein
VEKIRKFGHWVIRHWVIDSGIWVSEFGFARNWATEIANHPGRVILNIHDGYNNRIACKSLFFIGLRAIDSEPHPR